MQKKGNKHRQKYIFCENKQPIEQKTNKQTNKKKRKKKKKKTNEQF